MTIRDMRLAAGMTQKEFAEYFGIPKRTIENWESEKSKCPDYLAALIRYKLVNEKLLFKHY